MAQTAPDYFTGNDPIFAFGCAVPFGLTARQADARMEHGNGRKQELGVVSHNMPVGMKFIRVTLENSCKASQGKTRTISPPSCF